QGHRKPRRNQEPHVFLGWSLACLSLRKYRQSQPQHQYSKQHSQNQLSTHQKSPFQRCFDCARVWTGVCASPQNTPCFSLSLAVPLFMTLFHRTRDVNHGQKNEDEGLNRASEQGKKHDRHGGQEREYVLVER